MSLLNRNATEVAPPEEIPVTLRHRPGIDWMIAELHTMPGKLRVTMLFLVLGILLSGGIAGYAAQVRAQTTRDIAERIEPLNGHVTTMYRSLAAADAEVTSGFLSGGLKPGEMRANYDKQVAEATAKLAQAGAEAGEDRVTADRVTADRIADIGAQLPIYTGLVERARSNNRQGFPLGVAYLRRASELMQTSILPEAAELQHRQATLLDDAYRQAESVPILVTVAGTASLAGLIWAQLFLFRRTHRVFNIGLVAATATVLVGLSWWTAAGVMSAADMQDSREHSRLVSDALAPAQIAALQARATESIALLDRNGGATENDFTAQMQLLTRNDGAGGALGAARKFATDQRGAELVERAISEVRDYQRTHEEVRRRDAAGNYRGAVDAALHVDPRSGHATFGKLDGTLAEAIAHERTEFGQAINRTRLSMTGLGIGTGVLAMLAATGVVLGVRGRLEEYR